MGCGRDDCRCGDGSGSGSSHPPEPPVKLVPPAPPAPEPPPPPADPLTLQSAAADLAKKIDTLKTVDLPEKKGAVTAVETLIDKVIRAELGHIEAMAKDGKLAESWKHASDGAKNEEGGVDEVKALKSILFGLIDVLTRRAIDAHGEATKEVARVEGRIAALEAVVEEFGK